MSNFQASPVSLAVLNPQGRDTFVDYAQTPSHPMDGVHAPINFHAFAAATRGAFFDRTGELLKAKERFDAVLVLIRRRTWISAKAVAELQAARIPVLVAWKECSETQIARQLRSIRARIAYRKIIAAANGILSPTLASPPRPPGFSATDYAAKCRHIATPYPLELPGWDFSKPLESRSGIFVGTREFHSPTRNHQRALEALADLASKIAIPRVTVINTEGKSGSRKLHRLAQWFPHGALQIVESSLPYLAYMRLLASHRVVYQQDMSGVPGQVAGDCLLARTLCVGGNSAIEKIAFPRFCSDAAQSTTHLIDVLTNDSAYAEAVTESQQTAQKKLSFSSAANSIAEWIAHIRDQR